VENVLLVTRGAYPSGLSPFLEPENGPEITKTGKSDSQIPTPRAGYPWVLPTGQIVSWDQYGNGTQMIRLSANGTPPLSPDHVLTLLDVLRKDGLNDTWECVSIEANVDSRYLRVDQSISLSILEGLLIKVYGHGSSLRVELADRRRCSLGEVMGLLTGLAGAVDAREALQQCSQLREDLKTVSGTAQVALSNSRKVREKVEELTRPASPSPARKPPAPAFRAGADILKGRVADGAGKRGKTP